LAFNHYKYKPVNPSIESVTEFNGDISVGYFFVNKLAVGIRPDITISAAKFNWGNNVQRSFGFGPFVRYYLLPVDKKVNLFGDASLSYTLNSSNQGSGVYSRSWIYSFGAGAVVFVSPTVGLEGQFSYRQYSFINVEEQTNNLQFKIGLQAYLKRSK
jgi:hypothetical protein